MFLTEINSFLKTVAIPKNMQLFLTVKAVEIIYLFVQLFSK